MRSQIPADEFVTATEMEGTLASYPALRLKQNQQTFYFVTMPVSDIFPYCFVLRREEDPIQGFQRMLSDSRANDIARYLDGSMGSIPTNIVLSAQEEAELEYLSKKKTVRYRRTPKAFLVLDGQHRLYGYGLTKKPHRVPVAIYKGLTRKEEAALFIDINTNQRGVPAALLLDIKQVAEREDQTEAALRVWFDQLNTDPESPLRGLLSPSASRRGKISRVTFNRAVKEVLSNMVMEKLSDGKQYTLVRNYLTALEQALASRDRELLYRGAYFEAFCGLFDEALRVSQGKHQDYKLGSLGDVLAPLANIDLTAMLTGGRTKLTKATILPILKDAIRTQVEVDEQMV